jgi:NAD(P)-dependent dehydrogenase (short-subunit alcohol dehydrogenase family)
VAAIVAIIAWVTLQRAQAFWCEARSLPLATSWRTPGFSLDKMPNLHRKMALVTGANTGIGLEVSLQLALANATVVMACRDSAKCSTAVKTVTMALNTAGGKSSGSARAIPLDLSDLHQVDAACNEFIESTDALHILVNNAGVATQVSHKRACHEIYTIHAPSTTSAGSHVPSE